MEKIWNELIFVSFIFSNCFHPVEMLKLLEIYIFFKLKCLMSLFFNLGATVRYIHKNIEKSVSKIGIWSKIYFVVGHHCLHHLS